MSLREPKTIGDKSLLQDAPFKTYFETEGRRNETALFELVVDNMKQTEGGLKAARMWLRTAFNAELDTEDNPEKLLLLFVSFFRLLQREQTQDANNILRKERSRRGLLSFPPLIEPIPAALPTDSSPLVLRKPARTSPTERDASLATRGASIGTATVDPGPQPKGKSKKRRKKAKRRVTPAGPVASTSVSASEPAEDSDDSQRTLCVASDSDAPLSKKKRRSGTRDSTSRKYALTKKDSKVVVKSENATPQPQDLLAVAPSPPTRPQESTDDRRIDHNGPSEPPLRRAPRKSGSAKPRRKVVYPPQDTRPKKTRRLPDGSALEHGPPARLRMLRRYISAPPMRPGRLVQRWEESKRARKSQEATPSVTPAQVAQPHTTSRKRKWLMLEDANSVGTALPETVIPNTVDSAPRILIPPRKCRAKSTPLPAKPRDKFAVIDSQLNASGAVGLYLHQCTDPVAPEWAAENPDAQPDVDNFGGIESNTLSYPPSPTLGQTLQYPLIKMSPGPPEGPPLPYHSSPYHDYVPCNLFESGSASTDAKPPLPAFPPIWAQSRQEVCESFDWFRSYQGGVYFNKNCVKGYLLGGFSASRDIFHDNGKLIVSHGGGKAALSLGKEKEMLEASDQLEKDTSVRALLNTYRERRAVALVVDDNYALFPYSLASKGCTYAVLGWYRIVKAWAEYQSDPGTRGKVIRYKFAFQWCKEQGEPWWWNMSETDIRASPGPRPDSSESEEMKPATTHPCPKCKSESPVIYDPPMCHKPSCTLFCCIQTGQQRSSPVQYSPHFLRHHPLKLYDTEIAELKPPLPEVDEDQVGTSQHFCKGWHCGKCGRLSSRFKWENFECRNCGNIQGGGGRLRRAKEFRNQHTSLLAPKKAHSSIIVEWPRICGIERGLLMNRETYTLPEGRGRIHLLRTVAFANDEVDQLLELYQTQAQAGDLKFRRWPLRAHKCRGTLLTNYFSQNSGKPYQYVGGDENTVPFESAPSAVGKALAHIQNRIKQAELPFAGEFNEVLTAAYMEKQKMAFHSDAEKGLGPNVASLSLGASAHMYFRLHAKYSTDGTREVLRLYLRHGDVLVMEGAGVQIYYEHTVVPLNFRIAATARFIGKDHH